MSDLAGKLATFLVEQDLIHPEVPSLTAAQTIVQWLTEEYDRQVEQALGQNDPRAVS
ncbi:hypothetical protein [Mesorhizobium sp.]|uniref:hypothetical protein n=1 Tax=Mesorhizobium sp. TaxID=1871066 RepID=UPI00257C8136|nr:hypothetical protein [Mesorhizobium sp.]